MHVVHAVLYYHTVVHVRRVNTDTPFRKTDVHVTLTYLYSIIFMKYVHAFLLLKDYVLLARRIRDIPYYCNCTLPAGD